MVPVSSAPRSCARPERVSGRRSGIPDDRGETTPPPEEPGCETEKSSESSSVLRPQLSSPNDGASTRFGALQSKATPCRRSAKKMKMTAEE